MGNYFVWSPSGHIPTFQHDTAASARTEAERLARNNPGQEFFVLTKVARAKKVDVEWVEFVRPSEEFEESQIPF